MRSYVTGSFLNKQTKIKVSDLIPWAKQKGVALPPLLIAAMNPPSLAGQPKTHKATEKKIDAKVERLETLKRFKEEIDLRSVGFSWNSGNIPVTKEDFHEVFYLVYPNIPRVKASTLADDLPQIGIKFQPGRKALKNNVLKKIFGC